MRTIAWVGIALAALGVVLLVFHGIPYSKDQKVLDVGPVHASVEEKKTVPVSPVLSGILIGGGIILIVVGMKQRP